MLVAQEKKKNNIAEYILYMWQIEDLIRATGFDLERIDKEIISKYQTNELVRNEIREWYKGLVESMVRERITKAGHLAFVNQHIEELTYLHRNMLANKDEADYILAYGDAKPNIDSLKEKGNLGVIGDIELCLNGLYGLLLLRLAKRKVSEETEEAMQTFSALLAMLTVKYHSIMKKS